MRHPKEYFRHIYKCSECAKEFARVYDFELLANTPITCPHCHLIMPAHCEIDCEKVIEQSGDFEILCLSIVSAAVISNIPRDEIYCVNDVIETSLIHLQHLRSELRKEKRQ